MKSLKVLLFLLVAFAMAAIYTACEKDQIAPVAKDDLSLELREMMSGAIFTTNKNCTGVNVNIFDDKKDVYLDGGPRKPGAAGLPDGWYYIKVTDPSGAKLLGMTPPVTTGKDWRVEVVNGEFVQCYQLWAILEYYKNGGPAKQGYDDTPNPGGVYKVWASQYADFPNDMSKTDNFKVQNKAKAYNLNVIKFYDANLNGINDDGILLPGWKIGISGMEQSYIRYTPVSIWLGAGTYTVEEYMPLPPVPADPNRPTPYWIATTPTSVNVTLGPSTTVYFGNVCLGPGGGHSKGFWSNNNGRDVLETNPEGAVALLEGLNLFNNDGTPFNPATIYEFQDWLNGPVLGYLPYMLSQQLAAMSLNVYFGFVNGSAIVYAPGAGGFISVNNLIAAANACLASNCYNAEALSNALDYANNNYNFVQTTPCPYSFE